MQKECSISLRLYFLLFTVLLTSITFSQTVPAAPTSGGDSALARYYRDCSEVCDIAEIPKYVQLTLQTVRPHLAQAVITNEGKNYYVAIAATAINNLGFYFEHEGNRNEALRFLKFAAFLQKTIGDSKSLAVTLSNLGSVYETGGDVKQAIAHYYNSLKIREKINDLEGIANVTHNLSNLHFSVGNIEVASDYSKRALLKRRQLHDTSGVAFSYENLAILAAEQFDTASAINYYNTAAKAFERFGRKEYFASALVCEGTAKHFQRDFITARNNFEQAIAIYAEQNQLVQASSIYNRLSDVEKHLGHFSKAILYAEKAKELGSKTNNVLAYTGAYERLSKLYQQVENNKLAYANLKEFHQLADSVRNASNRNLVVIEDISHEFEKKAIQDSINATNDRKVFEVKLEEHRSQITYGFALILVITIMALYAFVKYKQITKQAKIIARQKIEVEKQKQLADSRLEISETQNRIIQNSLHALEETQESLLSAKLEAEKSSKAKSEFISHVSHEIRTPLNAILGFAELMKSKGSQASTAKYIDHILQSGNNLLSMVNELLDYSKIEAGHLQVRNIETNVSELLKDCSLMFHQTAEQKNIQFESRCQQGFPELLLIDALRLRQVIYNLLGNAIKFTNEGRVTVDLSYKYQNEEGTKVEIQILVSDTGIGIAEHQQKLIFEAFKQHEGQDAKKYGGTGLGLAITKKIVKALQGEISLYSEPKKGSTFTVTIPNVAVINKPESKEVRVLNGKTIVIIESGKNATVSEYAKNNRKRVHIISVNDYTEAAQILDKITPDLFVVALEAADINLKKQVDLYARARAKKIPVLFLNDKKESTTASLIGKAFDLQSDRPDKEQQIEETLSRAIAMKPEFEVVKKQIVHAGSVHPEALLIQWEQLNEFKSCEDISRFATELWQLSREHHLSQLFVYADKLLNAVEKYNLSEIYEVFADFKTVLDKQFEGVH